MKLMIQRSPGIRSPLPEVISDGTSAGLAYQFGGQYTASALHPCCTPRLITL